MSLRQSDLINKAIYYGQPIYENKQFSRTGSKQKSAFLCHSHKDEKIVKGLIIFFKESGIDLYIDWEDHSMPDTPNTETALKIQNKIRTSDLFLFLATANSKSSRWCPWEIGYADSSNKKIYIVPTSDDQDNYGNEYLGLYPRIDEGTTPTKKGLAVFEVGKTKGEWISSTIL